jgi:SAM-dependent methyltransferase
LIPGIFYTPAKVADTMVRGALALWLSERTGETFDESLVSLRRASPEALSRFRGVTLLDPSCGAGALLEAAIRALPGVDVQVAGSDIDPSALDRCRARLGQGAALELRDAREPGPLADVVLTNPPFGKDRGSPDIDRYVTFWAFAANRVKPGGVLAVLTPRSWQTGIRFAKARREVIVPSGVRRVIDLPHGSFKDAYVDTCIALCTPGSHGSAPRPSNAPAPGSLSFTTLGDLFVSRRGILAPTVRSRGERILVGSVPPFVWPRARSAFRRIRASDVVEGRGALRLGSGPRLLVRRIVGRAARLTCVVTSQPALVKKDFYVFVPRDPSLSLWAYAALLHARGVTARLAEAERACTKDDFAQLTLARLRDVEVPLLRTGSNGRAHSVAAWLEAWAHSAERLSRSLVRERARCVDSDPRWAPLRARLDEFVEAL